MFRGPEGEPFELLQMLGRGGFAETHRARVLDPELREEYGVGEVALKIPHDRRSERLLKKELELGLHLKLKTLRSPNLVRYLGFETFQGRIVMVMECEEGSLRNLIGRYGQQRPLAVEEAVSYTEGVANGLAVMHREQVFHRDIKPDNILLRRGVAKITDFGIGRLVEGDDLALTQAGTPPYTSPEIIRSLGATFSSDIWSLGVTLYEMLAGRLPFGDEKTSLKQMLDLICESHPRPVRDVRPEVPEALQALVDRMLAKNPADRISAEALAGALRDLRRGSDPQLDAKLAETRALLGSPGRAAEADARLRDLTARYPRDPRTWQLQGEFLARAQRHAEAAAAFGSGIKAAPDDGLLHYYLGVALQNLGRTAEAAAALERAMALELDPSLRRHAGILLKALR